MTHPTRQYKYYDLILGAFVCVLLSNNLVAATKIVDIGGFKFGAGVLFFPVSYIFGDILTEVYGYARARRVVWAGMAAQIFAVFLSQVVIAFPPAAGWEHQAALETIFGSTPRIIFASILAFFCGEFCNSYTLAKMKILSKGRALWTRTIGSTVVGEAVDSVIFYPLAFLGVWTTEQVIQVMLSNYALKVLWEVVNTPITYRVVRWLKRVEHEDYFDHKTDFTPFSLKT